MLLIEIINTDGTPNTLGVSSKHKTKPPKACKNCGCPEPKKTYSGWWCKWCKTEL